MEIMNSLVPIISVLLVGLVIGLSILADIYWWKHYDGNPTIIGIWRKDGPTKTILRVIFAIVLLFIFFHFLNKT